MGWVVEVTYILKYEAYLYALVLTIEELRKFIGLSRTKQRNVLCGVVYIPLIGSWRIVSSQWVHWLYHTSAWGFRVARFDNPGNAKAFL